MFSKRDMMRITCPQCGFFRELPDNKVPVTSTMATCPKCRHRFKFRPDSREPAAARVEPRSRVVSPKPETEESSWRRPGPAAARRDQAAPAATRFDPETLPDDDIPEIAAPQNRQAAPADPLPREVEDFSPPAAPKAQPQPEPSPDDFADEEEPIRPRRRAPAANEDGWEARRSRPLPEPELPAQEDPVPAAPPQRHVAPQPDEPAAQPPVFRQPDAQPTPEEPQRPQTPEEEPLADEPAAAPPQRRQADGVRDIWARLKAMDAQDANKRHNDESRDDDAPQPEAAPREVVTDPIPWERLDAYGFLPGLFLTLKKILFTPMAFFSEMPEGRPKGKALVFNLLISEFLLLLDFLWSLFGLRAKFGGPAAQPDALGAAASSQGLGFLIALLLVPLGIALGIYIDAWFTHLLLRLFRSAKKGFNETFRVMCYSAAPTVLTAIPVAGQILSPVILVWYMALQAIGLKKAHEGAYTQTLAAIFIKWSVYLFLLLAMLQNISPGH